MSSIIKVDNIQNQSGDNIIKEDSNTITLGASGDTISLAAGASQTGFGRTGTVDWETTPKTATFTAVSGEGYFCNTTGGAFTVNLPAGSAGAIVSVADYAATWQTNNLTITPNGSEKIGGEDQNATLSTKGQSVTFVYVDSTQGWINTMDSTSNVRGAPPFIVATGGTITCCGNYKIHTFTGPGTFTVCNTAICASDNALDYLVVAGGGGAGHFWGAGGGAGGARMSAGTSTGSYTVGPLGSAVSTLTASVQGYPITVGAGGSGGSSSSGNKGSDSVFSTKTSTGGGYGAGGPPPAPATAGGPGGSGGGMGSPNTGSGGTGNTPPVSPPQGQPGGPAGNPGAGGGGGATAAGGAATPGPGTGGTGVANNINSTTGQVCGSARYYAGGGGGDAAPGAYKPGGLGGGGTGPSGSGTANTGGGGGSDGGNGGAGVVVIRYKFQ